jgi:hypothetical protein
MPSFHFFPFFPVGRKKMETQCFFFSLSSGCFRSNEGGEIVVDFSGEKFEDIIIRRLFLFFFLGSLSLSFHDIGEKKQKGKKKEKEKKK